MPEPIVYTEHPVDVLGHAVRLQSEAQRVVLITSVDIRGGAARELGSLAVVSESGGMFGYMSNGCIDRDIREQALSLLGSGKGAKTLRYGEGSPFFDLKLPCGGSLELLLDADPDLATLRAAHRDLIARRSVCIDFRPPGGEEHISFEYAPKSRLAIAGRGAVFRATVQVAEASGFETLAYSPEEADLEAVAHLCAEEPVFLSTPRARQTLPLDRFSGFLTLFHDHDWEPELLKSALMTETRFIGCLGSQKTQQLRLNNLRADGVDPGSLERINGPIGLVPSLRNAPSIAISAIAEVVGRFPSSIRQVQEADKRNAA
ncbi:XdhC family protein [Shimia sp. SDUM112013]|uniref:XdhC family protein n=1 Tax=Shimia sp. SDUM112013 TaxID=3136160 RepID=UPI0032EFA876